MQQMIFIADFIACSTCFGQYYAHHQELESIIQMVAACGIWCGCGSDVELKVMCPVCRLQTGHITFSSTSYRQPENQAPNTTGSDHLYNTLDLLMMGIVVPETCWASNKICNKYHLLHLVGVLFPNINEDARSESLQIYMRTVFCRELFLSFVLCTFEILLQSSY